MSKNKPKGIMLNWNQCQESCSYIVYSQWEYDILHMFGIKNPHRNIVLLLVLLPGFQKGRGTRKNLKNGQNFTPFWVSKMFSHSIHFRWLPGGADVINYQ
jgi:hypothetical protein